jgi:DNA-binding beta-propeller fold protein YncE
MNRSYRWRRGHLVCLALVALFAGWVVEARVTKVFIDLRSVWRGPTGSAQLIAYEPLAADAIDDEDCQWVPVSAGTAVAAVPPLEEISRGVMPQSAEDASGAEVSIRKPVRMIRDRYASFSSVAVDAANDEVVLTDENLFNVLVYNRLDNTFDNSAITKSKRVIGGLKTKIEFQSGLYIDPENGDIYAVNNDTVDRLVVFSRQVQGDVRPDRQVHTPHGTFGIAADEAHQELLLTVQHDSAVVTFHKTAKTEDSPIRLLQGDHTLLADPHGIALDAKNDLIFVTNHGSVHQVRPGNEARERTREGSGGKSNWPLGFANAIPGSGKNLPPSITVYSRTASGDVAPLRVIQGPQTQMNWPTGIAFDPRTNEIFVANDMGDSILVFNASAHGDVAPIRVLMGPKTLIKNPTGVHVDIKNNELWVANFGNHTATVYKLTAAGDTAPLRVIRSAPADQPTLSIGNPHPVAYDTKREQILVPN